MDSTVLVASFLCLAFSFNFRTAHPSNMAPFPLFGLFLFPGASGWGSCCVGSRLAVDEALTYVAVTSSGFITLEGGQAWRRIRSLWGLWVSVSRPGRGRGVGRMRAHVSHSCPPAPRGL